MRFLLQPRTRMLQSGPGAKTTGLSLSSHTRTYTKSCEARTTSHKKKVPMKRNAADDDTASLSRKAVKVANQAALPSTFQVEPSLMLVIFSFFFPLSDAIMSQAKETLNPLDVLGTVVCGNVEDFLALYLQYATRIREELQKPKEGQSLGSAWCEDYAGFWRRFVAYACLICQSDAMDEREKDLTCLLRLVSLNKAHIAKETPHIGKLEERTLKSAYNLFKDGGRRTSSLHRALIVEAPGIEVHLTEIGTRLMLAVLMENGSKEWHDTVGIKLLQMSTPSEPCSKACL
ncbi:hypothetical protein BCR37DRAFT_162977 [Protomyces lactucae-debilis]|uniref:Uncharacterized protein n=1 Tax=Protomyces lactucae-debilis TaxID=2754530 RepID=A0A1Y2EYJ9_PROLT|nr:uncharacterized protein BCR37DRAFT_162977 [Protomyces lactucae-debilis]ORY76711.1 hypothetical protein BCR37DRAFT_162977 [Protomyces lactucae-debilis]